MSSNKEREERAFEALIVAQFRSECDPEKVKPEDLPKLTAKEKAALDALGSDLVERLWNEGRKAALPAPIQVGQIVMGQFVMNRADEGTEETKQELERRRRELLDRMKKLHEEKQNGRDS